MKLDFKIQMGEINLSKFIEEEVSKKPKKIYMFLGLLKESGFNIIEENIIDTNAKVYMYLGIDKKNTTKALLEGALKYCKEVCIYDNNNVKEFESNIYIFEYENKAVIYNSASNASESGLTEDLAVITKYTFDLSNSNEKVEYKENLKVLTEMKKVEFELLTVTKIQELLDNKIIFSNKQYEHTVRSISEFLGKKETLKKEVSSEDENLMLNLNLPKISFEESNLEIDISDAISDETETIIENKAIEVAKEEEVKTKKASKKEKQVFEDESLEDNIKEEVSSEVVDLGSMLLTKSKIKLNVTKKEEEPVVEDENKQDELISIKKLDLNNISNYIFEMPGKMLNGQDLDVLKIPNYIKDLIPEFFEFNEKAKTKIINGATYKARDIQVEIVDAKTGKKVFDKNAKIMQKKGQTYITIMSKDLEKIDYEENDISRIIKLSSDLYHIEIISKNLQEYKIWSKIMNKKLKGVDRKYGIM